MLEIALASHNPEKKKIISAIWRDDAKIITPEDLGTTMPADLENGNSYFENALAKASWMMEKCGAISIADDNGMEIIGLGRAPGVLTRRWDGDLSDRALLEKTIREISKLPESGRECDFIVCVTAIDQNRRKFSALEKDSGILLLSPRGPLLPGHPLASLLYLKKHAATLAELKSNKDFESKDIRAHKSIKELILNEYGKTGTKI